MTSTRRTSAWAGTIAALALLLMCIILASPANAYADSKIWPAGTCPAEANAACPAGGSHSFTATIETAATEDADGVRLYVCSKCGFTYRMAIPATGHLWGPWIVDVQPTCTTEGHEYRVCTRYPNNPHTEEQVIPRLSATGQHTWGDWIVDVEPTATSVGSEHRVCSVCGATETQEIPEIAAEQSTTTPSVQTSQSSTPAVSEPDSSSTAEESTAPTEEPAQSPKMLGPFVLSYQPTALDAVLATADLSAIAVTVVIMIPLLAALAWAKRRKREASLNAAAEMQEPDFRYIEASDNSSSTLPR